MKFELLQGHWFAGYDRGGNVRGPAVLLQSANEKNELRLKPFYSTYDCKNSVDKLVSVPMQDVLNCTVGTHVIDSRHSIAGDYNSQPIDIYAARHVPCLSEVDISYVMSSQSSAWSLSETEDDDGCSQFHFSDKSCDIQAGASIMSDMCNASQMSNISARQTEKNSKSWPIHGDILVFKNNNEAHELCLLSRDEYKTARHQTLADISLAAEKNNASMSSGTTSKIKLTEHFNSMQPTTSPRQVGKEMFMRTCSTELTVLGYEVDTELVATVYMLYAPQSTSGNQHQYECCGASSSLSGPHHRCLCCICMHVYNGEPLILRTSNCRDFFELCHVHDDTAVRIHDMADDLRILNDELLFVRLPVLPCAMTLEWGQCNKDAEAKDNATSHTYRNSFDDEIVSTGKPASCAERSSCSSHATDEHASGGIATDACATDNQSSAAVPVNPRTRSVLWSPPLSRSLLTTQFSVKTTIAAYNVRPFATPVVFVGVGCGVPWVMKQKDNSICAGTLECASIHTSSHLDDYVGQNCRDVCFQHDKYVMCHAYDGPKRVSTPCTKSPQPQCLDTENISDFWCEPLPRCYAKATLYKNFHAHYVLPCSRQRSLASTYSAVTTAWKSYHHTNSGNAEIYTGNMGSSGTFTNKSMGSSVRTTSSPSPGIGAIQRDVDKDYLTEVQFSEKVDEAKEEECGVCDTSRNSDNAVYKKRNSVVLSSPEEQQKQRATLRALAKDFQGCSNGGIDSAETKDENIRSFSCRDIVQQRGQRVVVLGPFGVALDCDTRARVLTRQYGVRHGSRLQFIASRVSTMEQSCTENAFLSVASSPSSSNSDENADYMAKLSKLHRNNMCTVVGVRGRCLVIFFDGEIRACVLPATINSVSTLLDFFRLVGPDAQVQGGQTIINTKKTSTYDITEETDGVSTNFIHASKLSKVHSTTCDKKQSCILVSRRSSQCMNEIQQGALVKNGYNNLCTTSDHSCKISTSAVLMDDYTSARCDLTEQDTPFLNFLLAYAYSKLCDNNDGHLTMSSADVVSANLAKFYLNDTLFRIRDAYANYTELSHEMDSSSTTSTATPKTKTTHNWIVLLRSTSLT